MLPEKERNPIDVPLHEMSLADLQKKVGQYEIELGNRARDVTPGTITDLTELTEEAT